MMMMMTIMLMLMMMNEEFERRKQENKYGFFRAICAAIARLSPSPPPSPSPFLPPSLLASFHPSSQSLLDKVSAYLTSSLTHALLYIRAVTLR